MSANYSFEVYPARSYVKITIGGFFEAADFAGFASAQDIAYRQFRCSVGEHVTLVDMRGMHIQSQAGVAAFKSRMSDPGVASRRIAFVVSRSLARMRVKRATDGLPARLYLSISDAEAWLMSAEYNDSSRLTATG